MSDPAFQSDIDPSGFTPIDAVPRDPNSVYLFDFDGVIASGVEDKIYKLTERPSEQSVFAMLEDKFSLRIGAMDFRYRRHLLFQQLAAARGLSIRTGPGFELAKWASDHARFFVLTARSGWAATARLRNFLEFHHLTPIDLYQVGRVHKERQVARVVEEFLPTPVYYIEDSLAHLAQADKLDLKSLTPVFCPEVITLEDVETLYTEVFGNLDNPSER
ncbi:MAG: hypothetical protein AAF678_02055 [Pseudomonadota bacterium]